MTFGDGVLDPDMDEGEVVVYDPNYGRAAMRFTRRFLEALYRMPHGILWQDDAERCRHADLPGLTDEALELEAFRVLLRMACEPLNRKDRVAWLRQRRERIAAGRATAASSAARRFRRTARTSAPPARTWTDLRRRTPRRRRAPYGLPRRRACSAWQPMPRSTCCANGRAHAPR